MASSFVLDALPSSLQPAADFDMFSLAMPGLLSKTQPAGVLNVW
jgi:hypothetical protein